MNRMSRTQLRQEAEYFRVTMRGRYYRLILSLCAKKQYDHTSLILSLYNTTLIDLHRYNIKENDFLFLLPSTYIQFYGEATTYDRFFSTYLSYWKFFFHETVPTIDFLYKEKPIAFFLAKFYMYCIVCLTWQPTSLLRSFFYFLYLYQT